MILKPKKKPAKKIRLNADSYSKFEIATIKALAKLLKKPLKSVQKAVNENSNLLSIISANFDAKKTPLQTAKDLKRALQPIVKKDPLNAFVELLQSKKNTPAKAKTSKAFPMKLPATVTIGKSRKRKIGNVPGAKDPDAVREIRLYIDNTSQVYFNKLEPAMKMIEKKYKAGKYDFNKSIKAYMPSIEYAMKLYQKEYGSPRIAWSSLLSVPDRKVLAYELASDHKAEMDLGNFL